MVGIPLRLLGSPAGRRRLVQVAVALGTEELRRRFLHPDALERLEQGTRLRNLVTKEAVGVIVALGIPDLVAAGTGTVAALADKTGADPDALGRVLRHLVANGILVEREPGVVALSDAGELLRSDHPDGQATFFQRDAVVARFEQALSGMLHSVMTGQSAYASVHGEDLWEQVARDPLMAASFDVEMVRHARSIGPVLAERYDWSEIATVIDVGGGTGALLRELLVRHQRMRGTVLEYADAAARARRAIDGAALGDRMGVVEASFLEAVPHGADAYLLSWILHDWNDDSAVTILERCREAAARSGRVLVIEQPLDVSHNTDLDLRMLVYFGGRERTKAEYEALSRRAGLSRRSWTELSDGFSVMDARPA